MVDDRHMIRALELALEWPHTHPNPRVGAVVVDGGGEVAGEGWHRGPGTDHAEVVALSAAGDRARGSTIYVTLEPCSSHGRTPPCVDALTSAGVETVVVATFDPDANASGRGVDLLRDAGVEVVPGVMESEARDVDPAYFRHRETGMPTVTLKWAMTLDGSVAADDGTSRWITSDEARLHAHEVRSKVDGVVVGAGTVRADDPRLDVRIESYKGPQPRPVIVAGTENLPADARVWSRDPVVVSTHSIDLPAGELVQVSGADVPDPIEACKALADLGLLHLLVEGGPTLAGAWWRAGVVTNGLVYVGAKVGGGRGHAAIDGLWPTITSAEDVELADVRNVGSDVLITFQTKT